MERNLINPRNKKSGVSELIYVPKCINKNFLHSILCKKIVMKIMPCVVVYLLIGHVIQLGKSIAVTHFYTFNIFRDVGM